MQTFFQSSILSTSVNHTLTIENLVDNGEFFLDYVEILSAAETTTPPTTRPGSTSPASPTQISTFPTTTVPGPTTTSASPTAPTPSEPNTTQTSASTTPTETPTETAATIDDRSPLLAYTGFWSQGGTSSEFDGTVTWTNVTGSTVSINFLGRILNSFHKICPLIRVRFSRCSN